jgi:hypothetical protein
MTDPFPSRAEASDAVADSGWRFLDNKVFAASVPVRSIAQGLTVAQAAAESCGPDADDHLRADVRADRVELVLQTRERNRVTPRDAQLATAITAAIEKHGLHIAPATGVARPVQDLEVAIDALDIPKIRPFWVAVLGYQDDPAEPGEPAGAIADPANQLPTFWFQQMDAPRQQRNRIHFDITVPHDEAERRLQAALDAGGTLVTDEHAKSFWVLADAEGNEICICTWQDRD